MSSIGRLRRRSGPEEPFDPVDIDWKKVIKVLGVIAGIVVLAHTGKSPKGPPEKPSGPQTAQLSAQEPPGPWLRGVGYAALGTPLLLEGGRKLWDWLGQIEVPPSQLAEPTPMLKPEVPRLVPQPSPKLAPVKEEMDQQLRDLISHPSVGVVVGKRGGGKTAFAYRVLEFLRVRAAPYVLGPASLKSILPDWIGVVQDMRLVPHNSVVLIDEAYLKYHSRSAMSEAGRGLAAVINLSRQRGWSMIFVAQEARQLDVNLISQIDWLAVKELSDFAAGFERKELRGFTDRARLEFQSVRGDKRQWAWLHSEPAGFEGLVRNQLPSFWKASLSTAFADSASDVPPASPETAMRPGLRISREERVRRAKEMREAGMSYGQIANSLGLSKSTAHDMVNEK